MQEILKLLPSLLHLAQNNDEVCERASFVAWKVTVGEAVSRISLPCRLARKTLLVAVMDETWQKQLEQMSGQILFKLNALLGTAIVTGLEFCVDPEAVRASHPSAPLQPPENVITDPKLAASATQIKDAELRAHFIKTASKYLQAQQQKER